MKISCSEYREDQLLLALRRRLADEHLSEKERRDLEAEVAALEAKLDLD